MRTLRFDKFAGSKFGRTLVRPAGPAPWMVLAQNGRIAVLHGFATRRANAMDGMSESLGAAKSMGFCHHSDQYQLVTL